jgi:predicted nucleic acid-binding Zn ribbon protein
MPTYLYESIPADPADEVVYYEVTHEADEPALTQHPETGEAWRRVTHEGEPVIVEEGGGCSCGEEGCC